MKVESKFVNDMAFVRFNHKLGEQAILRAEGFSYLLEENCDASELLYYQDANDTFEFITKETYGYVVKLNDQYYELSKKLLHEASPKTIEYVEFGQTQLALTHTKYKEYTFFDKETDKAIDFEGGRHRFLGKVSDGFLFYVRNRRERYLMKYTEKLSPNGKFEFGKPVREVIFFEGFVYVFEYGAEKLLSIIDGESFEVLLRSFELPEGDFRLHYFKGEHRIFAGGELFIWDGRRILSSSLSIPFSSVEVAGNYYFLTSQSSNLVTAVDANTLQKIISREVFPPGYEAGVVISNQGKSIAYGKKVRDKERNGYKLIAGWPNKEFFEEQAWDVRLESKICKEENIMENGVFSCLLEVECESDLAKVARQSLAFTDEIVNKHGVQDLRESSSEEFSPLFNGIVIVRFLNSKILNNDFKNSISNSLNHLFNSDASYLLGYANGKKLPLQLKIEFID